MIEFGFGIVHRKQISVKRRAKPIEQPKDAFLCLEHGFQVRDQIGREETLRQVAVQQVPSEYASTNETLGEVYSESVRLLVARV